MTTIFRTTVVCASCNREFRTPSVFSTSIRGAFDLDSRPPPLARHNMHLWVQACDGPEGCGYCAPKLSSLVPGARDVMARPEYRAASKLRRWAMIAGFGAPDEDAAEALTWCAWEADDAGRDSDAAAFRIRSAQRHEEARGRPGSAFAIAQRDLVISDLWRRAGRWDEAREAARRGLAICPTAKGERWTSDPRTHRAALQFELLLILRRDAARHTFSEVEPPDD